MLSWPKRRGIIPVLSNRGSGTHDMPLSSIGTHRDRITAPKNASNPYRARRLANQPEFRDSGTPERISLIIHNVAKNSQAVTPFSEPPHPTFATAVAENGMDTIIAA